MVKLTNPLAGHLNRVLQNALTVTGGVSIGESSFNITSGEIVPHPIPTDWAGNDFRPRREQLPVSCRTFSGGVTSQSCGLVAGYLDWPRFDPAQPSGAFPSLSARPARPASGYGPDVPLHSAGNAAQPSASIAIPTSVPSGQRVTARSPAERTSRRPWPEALHSFLHSFLHSICRSTCPP